MTPEEPVLQARCPWCDAGQDDGVVAFSYGQAACLRCGRYSSPMSFEQMLSIRNTNISMTATSYTCVSDGQKFPNLGPMLQHLREEHPL